MGNGLHISGFSPNALAASSFASNALGPAAFDPDAAMRINRGVIVDRATANLPQTTAHALFTVSGRVLLLMILGEVTTVIQTQANNTKLVFNPTATGSSVDMCAALDVTAKAVASFFAITGTLANAMTNGMLALMQATPLILQAGTIDLDCAASNTGQVKWQVRYLPLDSGATVVAA